MALEEVNAALLEQLKAMNKRVLNPNARRRTEERHEKIDYEAESIDGRFNFRIYVRKSITYRDAYSCGIRWIMPSGETLTLARYNGSSHVHADIRYKCHIHRATEESILQGRKPEWYAEETDRYSSAEGALHCLVKDYHLDGLETKPDQPELF